MKGPGVGSSADCVGLLAPPHQFPSQPKTSAGGGLGGRGGGVDHFVGGDGSKVEVGWGMIPPSPPPPPPCLDPRACASSSTAALACSRGGGVQGPAAVATGSAIKEEPASCGLKATPAAVPLSIGLAGLLPGRLAGSALRAAASSVPSPARLSAEVASAARCSGDAPLGGTVSPSCNGLHASATVVASPAGWKARVFTPILLSCCSGLASRGGATCVSADGKPPKCGLHACVCGECTAVTGNGCVPDTMVIVVGDCRAGMG